MPASPKPYAIHVEPAVLDDLHERLRRTRWTDASSSRGWDAGVDVSYLRALVDHWLQRFDWRRAESALNALPQFRVEIDGTGVHFIHVRGRGEQPMPLILTHGWPGSVWQMSRLIPLLADPAAHGGTARDAFDVVVPSLPGFGFSDRPTQAGWARRIPDLLARLMTQVLGYARFGAHGGDVGSGVTEAMLRQHAASLIGAHLTDVPYMHIFRVPPDQLKPAEKAYLDAGRQWQMSEGGYAMLQATKPQTLAVGLADSPAGLAAWIVEKLRAWSDCDGDIEQRFTMDDVLTNVTIYWATGTIGSSLNHYKDVNQRPYPGVGERAPAVPTGFAMFPKDMVNAPREFAARIFNVQRWTEMPRGGHFASFEEPELLAQELRAFFRPLRG